MADRFELTRVRLRQYRSIASCDVRLGKLTFLVGPNGAGKSNFVDALRLVSDALQGTLDNALRDRGGVSEVRRRSTGHPTHFRVEFDFHTATARGGYSFEIGAVRGGEFALKAESCHMADLAKGEAYFEVRDGALTGTSEPTSMPAVVSDRLYLVAASGLEAFRPVFEGLTGIGVYNLNPDAMRRPQSPDSGEMLRRDGSNLASVIERLRREDPETKNRIEDYLRVVVPGLGDVSRVGVGAWETLQFRQDVPGASNQWSFPAISMSDGTLRALGVLTALFAATGAATFAPIAIEEPEAALHAAATGALLEALRDASERRQILVTTHSADLLDSPEVAEDELRAVRADRGRTVIERIDPAGRRALREHLFTAGELLRVDQLQPDPNPETPVQEELAV